MCDPSISLGAAVILIGYLPGIEIPSWLHRAYSPDSVPDRVVIGPAGTSPTTRRVVVEANPVTDTKRPSVPIPPTVRDAGWRFDPAAMSWSSADATEQKPRAKVALTAAPPAVHSPSRRRWPTPPAVALRPALRPTPRTEGRARRSSHVSLRKRERFHAVAGIDVGELVATADELIRAVDPVQQEKSICRDFVGDVLGPGGVERLQRPRR